jgi:aryl-alcohol dehydrogenase-like predicted oxidoreductase
VELPGGCLVKMVPIGSSAIKIVPLVFGGNVFGWTTDEARSFQLLDAFFDAGFNCIDTADVYARFIPGMEGGESETVIGRWFEQRPGRRKQMVVCTKLGLEMGPGQSGLSAAYVRRAAEASLRRLRTDYIDLYISHAEDPHTPVEETLGAYADLIREGKIRAIGASNHGADGLAKALQASRDHGLPRYESLQPLYNLYERTNFEGPLERVCADADLSVFPYFSLASGFLTGKYRSAADAVGADREGFVGKYFNERGHRILTAMDGVAKETGYTLSQIALVWLLSRPTVTAPIASATTLSQLNEMIKVVDLRLTAEQLSALDATGSPDRAPAAAKAQQ